MRNLISGLLISSAVIAPMTNSAALENNALYQWETKNGTPTYSPDPPPKGVKYVVVGPDLKPLAIQPTVSDDAVADVKDSIVTTHSTTNIVTDAAPAKKWKPVRYANAPSNNAQVIIKAKANQPALTNKITTLDVPVSRECQVIKRERMILESQFSRAKTDREMDDTILKLHEKSIEYGKQCG